MNDHDEGWLADVQVRLRGELDDLYSRLEEKASSQSGGHGDPETQRHIARILRTFHRIETGQYGTCLICGGGISTAWLSQYPTSDACEGCVPPPPAMLS